MKKTLLLAIATLTITIQSHAQNAESFQINGEILPREISCTIKILSIDMQNTNVSQLKGYLSHGDWGYGEISFEQCSVNIEDGQSYPSVYLDILPRNMSKHPDYWPHDSTASSAIGIELQINQTPIPPTGFNGLSVPLNEGQAKYQTRARVVNIDTEGVLPNKTAQVSTAISFVAHYK